MDSATKSTPRSKTITKATLPKTPNKYYKIKSLRLLKINTLSNCSPSKSTLTSRNLIVSNQLTIQAQTLKPLSNSLAEDDDTVNESSEDEFNMASIFDDDYGDYVFGSQRTVSPFSDVDPNDMKHDNLSWDDNENYTFPTIHQPGSLINKLNCDLREILDPVRMPEIHQPCHRRLRPKRSLLKVPSSLNLLVESSRGSLEDATIFATEINTYTSSEDNRLPIITNEWQKITIPVSTNLKERQKILKQKFLNTQDIEDSFVSDVESSFNSSVDLEIADAAIIRGHKFVSCNDSNKDCNDNNTKDSNNLKTIKWSITC